MMKQSMMGSSVLRKGLFKEIPSGPRPAGKEPALCGVWGEPGEEVPRQRGIANTEAGPF